MKGVEVQDDGNIWVHSTMRAIAGNCPKCGGVVIVLNMEGSWPLIKCRCGWSGSTHVPLNKVRLERVDPKGVEYENTDRTTSED